MSTPSKKEIRKVVLASLLGATIEWYDFFLYGKQKRLLMHPATSALLEKILLVLRDEGEDAAFDYVRREVLGK